MDIKVEKINDKQITELGIKFWPVWEKEVSRFNWYYDATEECYILEGKVTVTPKQGVPVTFGKGDFVTFKKGLSCEWNVQEAVRKHYNFK